MLYIERADSFLSNFLSIFLIAVTLSSMKLPMSTISFPTFARFSIQTVKKWSWDSLDKVKEATITSTSPSLWGCCWPLLSCCWWTADSNRKSCWFPSRELWRTLSISPLQRFASFLHTQLPHLTELSLLFSQLDSLSPYFRWSRWGTCFDTGLSSFSETCS